MQALSGLGYCSLLIPGLCSCVMKGVGHSIAAISARFPPRKTSQTQPPAFNMLHRGSVNSKEEWSQVVFYEIQETTERFMYDTTVIGLAPLLLFAPAMKEVHRGCRVVFELDKSHVAVSAKVADALLSLRGLVSTFLDRSVGARPTKGTLDAAMALSGLFAETVATVEGDGAEDEDSAKGEGLDGETANPLESIRGEVDVEVEVEEEVELFDAWDSDEVPEPRVKSSKR